jgi:SAM-dependent methyltransferase
VEPAQTGRLYDAIATWWDEQQATSTSGLAYVRRAAQLPADRRRALDVGHGSGRLTAALTGAGYQVVGVDVSPGLPWCGRGRGHQTAAAALPPMWTAARRCGCIAAQAENRPPGSSGARALRIASQVLLTA